MLDENVFYIYRIRNKLDDKSYIGQTNNYEKRWDTHIKISHNENDSCYNLPLYCAIREYGIDNFEFLILESTPTREEAYAFEAIYIDYYNTVSSVYNKIKPSKWKLKTGFEYAEDFSSYSSEFTPLCLDTMECYSSIRSACEAKEIDYIKLLHALDNGDYLDDIKGYHWINDNGFYAPDDIECIRNELKENGMLNFELTPKYLGSQ